MEKLYSIIKKDYWSGINSYLEVHIRNVKDMSDIQRKLEKLPSVKRANCNNGYFIVYVREPYTIIEAEKDINTLFKIYYDEATSEELHLTSNLLGRFGKAKSIFTKACQQYGLKDNTRECLDNFRLSIELLLKELLQNDKSLENQREPLKSYLNNKNVSSEISTLFWHVLDCFSKYQNNHVKHDINIAENDISIIIEQTKSLINTIMKLERE